VCLVDARNPVLDAGPLRLADLAGLPWVAPYYRSSPNPSAAESLRGADSDRFAPDGRTLATAPTVYPL
jgi:hypothetical protein